LPKHTSICIQGTAAFDRIARAKGPTHCLRLTVRSRWWWRAMTAAA